MTYRYILATLVALGLTLGLSAGASASPFVQRCAKTYVTNTTAHRTCLGVARHYATGRKAWPTITRWDARDKCHVTYWLTGSRRVGPTKGEAFKARCVERGRLVTYNI